MAIRNANEITADEYRDGIFVIEDADQMSTGVWWIPDDWTPGNRLTAYARWYADRDTAQAHREKVMTEPDEPTPPPVTCAHCGRELDAYETGCECDVPNH